MYVLITSLLVKLCCLQLNAKVQQAAVAVGLDGDGFFTKAGQLSGGMRRRLSIAMSLVGDPPIIFMDGE